MVVSEESVVQRFEGAHAATKEAVETISLWILHYKDKQSIDRIVDVWIRVFKNACSESHRTALFYIMNDAVQNAKRKHIDYLIPAFQPAVLSAITEARDSPKVKKVMSRCIEIFRDREVFTKASVTAMQNILHGTETGDIDDGCLELNNSEVCMNIEAFDEGCKVSEELKDIVMRTNFETFNMLKRRVVDKRAAYYELERTKDVQEILTEVRHSMEAQKKRMLELVETLEIAKRLYSHSLKEVAVVEDAYVKYYKEIVDTKRELLDMKTSGVYPAATPPGDCPSPTANDDLFADGFSSPFRDNQGSTAMDMEIDDEESVATTSVPSAMSISTPVTPFLQDFNQPPPNWKPNGATNVPPSGVLPLAFNLPPPQLMSPSGIPPYIPGLPPNFSAPPPLISPSTSAQDQRQTLGFGQQTPPVVNSQAFVSQPSGSHDTLSRHQTERNTSYNSERRGEIQDRNFDGYQDRRDSFNHGRRGADRNYERGNGGFRRDSWDRSGDRESYGGGRDRDGNRDNRGFHGRGGGGNGYRKDRWEHHS